MASALHKANQFRSRAPLFLRCFAILLVLFGLAALVYVSFVLIHAYLFQQHASLSLEEKLRKVQPRLVNVAPQLPDGSVIGRIEIPRVGISSIILEGVGSATLQLGIGHIPGTALPNSDGNSGLAGHRDTFFRGLRNIKKEDEIIVTTPNGRSAYVVRSIAVVTPDDIEVLKNSRHSRLTLVTCYPFSFIGPAPMRYVVQADRIDG